MRILLVSDAWEPQVNGVVRTLATTVGLLRARGHAVETITPDRFCSLPCPTYPEIRLALAGRKAVAATIEDFAPDAIHIATEGPLGWRARGWCRRHGVPFTTSFHTRFPDYVAARTGLPESWLWRLVRHFHAPAAHVLAATPRLEAELAERGLRHTLPWSRGVDMAQFSPDVVPDPAIAALPGPIQLSVGRIAVEKNLTAFLEARTSGSKVVIGDGPALATLRIRYPKVHFLGPRHGATLAAAYAAADVFVFPSLTDTFGLVMIEALACGVPVAGFPVPGPLDIVGADGRGNLAGRGPRIGVLDDDLEKAISRALRVRRTDCAAYARHFSWDACADQFLTALATIGPLRRIREAAYPSPVASGFRAPA